MIPVAFDYVTPATLDEAIALLAFNLDARVIAGGQSLIPAMSTRRLAPSMLVDLRRIAGLRGITALDGSGVRVGAATTLDELGTSMELRSRASALADAAVAAGDTQVRHLGTLGGALADGHPAGDLIAAVSVLDAVVTLVGPDGERSMPAAQLVTGPYQTCIGRGEILISVHVPAPAGRSGSSYVKVRHPGSGYAICGAAAAAILGADGGVLSVRVALTGVADHSAIVEGIRTGGGAETMAQAAAAAVGAAGLAFVSDLAASGEYRAHLAGVLAGRAVDAAVWRARQG